MAGEASASLLAAACESVWIVHGLQSRQLTWRDLGEECEVTIDHLVRLCDAVIQDQLEGECLAAIAFGLIADDSFSWDTDTPAGNRIGETLNDWSAPEINYALTPATLAKFRHRLLTGEDTFTKDDLWNRRGITRS